MILQKKSDLSLFACATGPRVWCDAIDRIGAARIGPDGRGANRGREVCFNGAIASKPSGVCCEVVRTSQQRCRGRERAYVSRCQDPLTQVLCL